jgi:hypothetical protein
VSVRKGGAWIGIISEVLAMGDRKIRSSHLDMADQRPTTTATGLTLSGLMFDGRVATRARRQKKSFVRYWNRIRWMWSCSIR